MQMRMDNSISSIAAAVVNLVCHFYTSMIIIIFRRSAAPRTEIYIKCAEVKLHPFVIQVRKKWIYQIDVTGVGGRRQYKTLMMLEHSFHLQSVQSPQDRSLNKYLLKPHWPLQCSFFELNLYLFQCLLVLFFLDYCPLLLPFMLALLLHNLQPLLIHPHTRLAPFSLQLTGSNSSRTGDQPGGTDLRLNQLGNATVNRCMVPQIGGYHSLLSKQNN